MRKYEITIDVARQFGLAFVKAKKDNMKQYTVRLTRPNGQLVKETPVESITRKDAKKAGYLLKKQYEAITKERNIIYKVI